MGPNITVRLSIFFLYLKAAAMQPIFASTKSIIFYLSLSLTDHYCLSSIFLSLHTQLKLYKEKFLRKLKEF